LTLLFSNITGDFLPKSQKRSGLEVTTLGNQYGI
jgi:hypothetical protein